MNKIISFSAAVSALFFIVACNGVPDENDGEPIGSAKLSTIAESVSVSTFSGLAVGGGAIDGEGGKARFYLPRDLVHDDQYLYVADTWNCTIRKIEMTSGVVSTLAGKARECRVVDGQGEKVRLAGPGGLAISDQQLYILDNGAIRKLDLNTGEVSSIAGKAAEFGAIDGIGAEARFDRASGIAIVGANLYIADTLNHTIRQIDIATGTVTTLAGKAGIQGWDDGMGSSARFQHPEKVVANGSYLYVTDSPGTTTMRKIDITTGAVTTPPGPWAYFYPVSSGSVGSMIKGLAMNDSSFFVADSSGLVRQIMSETGDERIIAGKAGANGYRDGVNEEAHFMALSGLALDGSNLYVTDERGHNIRKIVIDTGKVTTLAGSGPGAVDGSGSEARYYFPEGAVSDGTYLYVTDTYNQTVRKLVLSNGEVSTLAGKANEIGAVDGVGDAARFSYPGPLAIDSNFLYVAQFGVIRRIDLGDGTVISLSLTALPDTNNSQEIKLQSITGMVTDGNELFVIQRNSETIHKVDLSSMKVTNFPVVAGEGMNELVAFDQPTAITMDENFLYVADRSYTVRSIDRNTRVAKIVAGTVGKYGSLDGISTQAKFKQIGDIVSVGNTLYIADSHKIRMIDKSTKEVVTIAGTLPNAYRDGQGNVAQFNSKGGIAVVNKTLYFVDTYNHVIRRLTLDWSK